jgi:hypothetical protein
MYTLYTVWNLFLLFSVFIVPQLLGLLAYFRIRHYQRALAHLAGVLIPPGMFFYFALMEMVYLPQRNHPSDGCGMAAAAGFFIALLGAGAQTGISILIQLVLSKRRLRRAA